MRSVIVAWLIGLAAVMAAGAACGSLVCVAALVAVVAGVAYAVAAWAVCALMARL